MNLSLNSSAVPLKLALESTFGTYGWLTSTLVVRNLPNNLRLFEAFKSALR